MKYYVGKCDYERPGQYNCATGVEWKLVDGRFSMTGEIWQSNRRDICCGGQCLDTILKYFPNDPLLQRMHAIWQRWHLNDMRAGSPRQEAWLRENPLGPESYRYPKSHYAVASEALTAHGLNPDTEYLHNGKPYTYGSAWLKEELPEDVVNEINSWSSYATNRPVSPR